MSVLPGTWVTKLKTEMDLRQRIEGEVGRNPRNKEEMETLVSKQQPSYRSEW